MQFRCQTQTLLPFLLVLLRIIEIDKHTVILHIILYDHRTLIRKSRLRFIAIDLLFFLIFPQQRMIECLLPTHTLLLADLQALMYEIDR